MIAIFPEIVHLAMNKDFESLAVAVRKYFAVGRPAEPKIDVESLVRDFGLGVSQVELDYPAILVGDDTKNGFHFNILVSQSLSPLEQKFALGHLLGHFLFHIQPLLARGEFEKSGWKEEVSPLVRYISGIGQQGEELIADQFAAALLMPQGMILKAHEKLSDIRLVSEFFSVSQSLATRRLEELARIARPGKIQTGLTESLEKPPINYRRTMEPYPKQSDSKNHNLSSHSPNQDVTRSSQRLQQDWTQEKPEVETRVRRSQVSSKGQNSAIQNSSRTEQSLINPKASDHSSTLADSKHAKKRPDDQSQAGLERLRALARKIDKSIER